jgi:hypothetical protein
MLHSFDSSGGSKPQAEQAARTGSSVDRGDAEIGQLRTALLKSVIRTATDAAQRMERSQVKSTFRTVEDQKAAVKLIALIPHLIKPDTKDKASDDEATVHCPECFLCGEPPGSHWAHDCPRFNWENPEELVFDYKTQSVFRAEDLGDPALRLHEYIPYTVEKWILRNNVDRTRYQARCRARELRETAEDAIQKADTAIFLAKRSGDINAKVASDIAKHAAEEFVTLMDDYEQLVGLSDPKSLDPRLRPHSEQEADLQARLDARMKKFTAAGGFAGILPEPTTDTSENE